MPSFFEGLFALLASVTEKDTRICRKCKGFWGTMFCDRAMLGEPGACEFEVLAPCKKCRSKVPCFGLPCELADRIAEFRKDRG